MAQLIFRDQNYVSSAIRFVCVYVLVYTLGAWAARTGSGLMLMRGDIFAASRGGGAGY